MTADATALAILFPDLADPLERIRARHDPAAGMGLPPHITVLFPFLPPDEIDDAVHARLDRLCAAHPALEVHFPRLARFDGALWLAPDPAEPFAELTRAVWDAFPDNPPYGGAHDAVIPHLTIAEGDLAAAQAAASRLRLPLSSRADALSLLAHEDGQWRETRRHALSGATHP